MDHATAWVIAGAVATAIVGIITGAFGYSRGMRQESRQDVELLLRGWQQRLEEVEERERQCQRDLAAVRAQVTELYRQMSLTHTTAQTALDQVRQFSEDIQALDDGRTGTDPGGPGEDRR